MAQFGQETRKRPARYAESDDDEQDDGLTAFGIKKQRTLTTNYSACLSSSTGSLPSHPGVVAATAHALISPPVTPTPLLPRQTSDIAMEDLDMHMDIADSQPVSQREWAPPGLHIDVHLPSFVQQDSNLSATSMLDVDDHHHQLIERPHTPGQIMRDMTRLEVSPSSELQGRGWMGMGRLEDAVQQSQRMQHHFQEHDSTNYATAGSKGRFTMGYRADCEKCRNRVPGHYVHPPTL